MEKSNAIFLLGAGASKSAGVPLAAEMTEKMLQNLERRPDKSLARALRVIIGALQMVDGDAANFSTSIDIERVLNAAILLGERSDLEFSPFVAAWHPVLESLEAKQMSEHRARSIGRKAAERTSHALRPRFNNEVIDHQKITDAISEALGSALFTYSRDTAKAPSGALFQHLTEELTRQLEELAYVKDAHDLNYLSPLIELGRKEAITIATLNYDNSIERQATNLGIEWSTGLDSWAKTGELPVPDVGIDLMKLHGSITWTWTEGRRQYSKSYVPSDMYRHLSELDHVAMTDRHSSERSKELFWYGPETSIGVIFGGRNKLTVDGPYLDLLSKFRTTLRRHSKLYVAGYSFRDQHINLSILQWLLHNSENRLEIIDRPKVAEDSHEFYSEHRQYLETQISFRPVGIERWLSSMTAK